MNQAELGLLVAGLRLKVGKPLKMRHIDGPRGLLERTRQRVTDLISEERILAPQGSGILTRLYTERLISDAVMYGDKHKHTMEMADWWLEDKSLVHKLFKVLVPRYQNYQTNYTRMFFCPTKMPQAQDIKYQLPKEDVVIELKGHPFPPLAYSNVKPNKRHIHNVLLSEAKRDFRTNDDFLVIDNESNQSSEK